MGIGVHGEHNSRIQVAVAISVLEETIAIFQSQGAGKIVGQQVLQDLALGSANGNGMHRETEIAPVAAGTLEQCFRPQPQGVLHVCADEWGCGRSQSQQRDSSLSAVF